MILDFWEAHGLPATQDAFGVSRSTLFRWKEALTTTHGRLDALDPKSTAPHRKRQRTRIFGLETRIIELRRDHYRIGKKKLTSLLRDEGFNLSESYVGRVLTSLKKRGLLPSYKHMSLYAKSGRLVERHVVYRRKLRRPKEKKRGVEIDTVVRFVDGLKRYIVTAINVETRFAFAWSYSNHSSASASDFLEKLRSVSPHPITEIQTDNGSEFAG